MTNAPTKKAQPPLSISGIGLLIKKNGADPLNPKNGGAVGHSETIGGVLEDTIVKFTALDVAKIVEVALS